MKRVGIICSKMSTTIDAIENYLKNAEVSFIKDYYSEDLEKSNLTTKILHTGCTICRGCKQCSP